MDGFCASCRSRSLGRAMFRSDTADELRRRKNFGDGDAHVNDTEDTLPGINVAFHEFVEITVEVIRQELMLEMQVQQKTTWRS
ncbi:hypothetical protein RB195_003000 [Necator americanus]|uniref:Uncharacterized protein n=1 Tax=Necator americanus TaxID=51031 RepID=A0ABR1DLM2_NECAM